MGEQETKLLLCVLDPTCVFVVGWGLWSLSIATLLEEEGGSFDHEEALTEAEKCKWKTYLGVLTRVDIGK